MPQNPRRICVGRDLWRSSGLILCSEQDQLEQVAECHVDFQVLPRVKFYHLSKSALPTSWWTRVFLMFMLQWLEVENWTGFLQRLQCFHLWRYSKAASVWFWAASSRWPWLSRGTGQDDLSLINPLWFCCVQGEFPLLLLVASLWHVRSLVLLSPFPSGNSRQQ